MFTLIIVIDGGCLTLLRTQGHFTDGMTDRGSVTGHLP